MSKKNIKINSQKTSKPKLNKIEKLTKNADQTETAILNQDDNNDSLIKRIANLFVSENKLINFALWTIAEVGFVVIGILLAFQIDSWNASKELKKKEIIYLVNLNSDLAGQISNINSQIRHEKKTRSQCEVATVQLQSIPYDIPKLQILISNLTRQTLVVSDSVFEDLKSSGNLAIISDIQLRKEIIQFYQFVDYVVIAISTNNTNFIDPFYQYLLSNSLVDYGFKKDLFLSNGIDFSANVEPFKGSEKIILTQLENKVVRFSLYNHLSSRARLSSAHLFLLSQLKSKNQNLATKLLLYLKNKKL